MLLGGLSFLNLYRTKLINTYLIQYCIQLGDYLVFVTMAQFLVKITQFER